MLHSKAIPFLLYLIDPRPPSLAKDMAPASLSLLCLTLSVLSHLLDYSYQHKNMLLFLSSLEKKSIFLSLFSPRPLLHFSLPFYSQINQKCFLHSQHQFMSFHLLLESVQSGLDPIITLKWWKSSMIVMLWNEMVSFNIHLIGPISSVCLTHLITQSSWKTCFPQLAVKFTFLLSTGLHGSLVCWFYLIPLISKC